MASWLKTVLNKDGGGIQSRRTTGLKIHIYGGPSGLRKSIIKRRPKEVINGLKLMIRSLKLFTSLNTKKIKYLQNK